MYDKLPKALKVVKRNYCEIELSNTETMSWNSVIVTRTGIFLTELSIFNFIVTRFKIKHKNRHAWCTHSSIQLNKKKEPRIVPTIPLV